MLGITEKFGKCIKKYIFKMKNEEKLDLKNVKISLGRRILVLIEIKEQRRS
jgi:hypothetical protein